MAEETKTIRESFFDAKAIGSLWDVAVSLKRGNPLPIDADSVFESEAKLIEYIGDKITTVAYPGQVVAVVNADSTQIFYIDQNLDYHPVGAKLDADGKSIKIDNNVLKLVGFDEAEDGLLAQVKVDAEGNRTLNWVSIETIAQGDGNTTYTFTGISESNVYFEVQASDAESATKIYLDAYTKKEIDDKFAALVDKDTTYTFADGTEGKFTVTPKDGQAQTVDTGAKDYVDGIVGKASEGEEAATGLHKVIEDTAKAVEAKIPTVPTNVSAFTNDAEYQNATQVGTAISTALADYYNKEAIDGKVEDLEGKISAIPKFAIEVVETLPTEGISGTTVYLVPDNDTATADVYDEFIYVKGAWELLGKQTLDLTGYATETFVSQEIAKLSADGGAIKVVADELDTLEQAHNELAGDVETLTGDVEELQKIDHQKIAEDAAATAVDTHYSNAPHLSAGDVNSYVSGMIDAHLEAKDHFTSEEIASQVAGILTTADYEGKIATAKEEAIAAALIKSIDEDQFTVDEAGKLTLDEIAQSKVTGLADTFANIYTKTEVDDIIGDKPTKTTDENGKNTYSGATGLYVDIYTKDEVTDLISSFTGGESAADVLAELNKYKSSNDARVKDIEDAIGKKAEGETPATGIIGDIAAITAKLDTIEEGAQVNVLEGVKVNGVALAITDKLVDIPAATADKFGVVKLGSEFNTAEDGTLEVKELNVNKLVQTEGDVLILDGGLATSLLPKAE
jgi:hypothetical protein